MRHAHLNRILGLLVTLLVSATFSLAQITKVQAKGESERTKTEVLDLVQGAFAVNSAGDSVVIHQTNPSTHVHTIKNESGNSVKFSAKLTMGHLKSADSTKNGDIDGVAFELKNQSSSSTGYDFSVDQVRLLHSEPSNTKSWNFTPAIAVNKGKTGNWSNAGRISGYKWNKTIMEIRILFGQKTWLLKWDPTKSGSSSTSVAEL